MEVTERLHHFRCQFQAVAKAIENGLRQTKVPRTANGLLLSALMSFLIYYSTVRLKYSGTIVWIILLCFSASCMCVPSSFRSRNTLKIISTLYPLCCVKVDPMIFLLFASQARIASDLFKSEVEMKCLVQNCCLLALHVTAKAEKEACNENEVSIWLMILNSSKNGQVKKMTQRAGKQVGSVQIIVVAMIQNLNSREER